MNELVQVKELIDDLNYQSLFINEYSDDIVFLMRNISSLKSKFNRPLLFYITKEVYRGFDNQPTVLIERIEKQLDSYLNENWSKEESLSVKFKNLRGLTFSVFIDETEMMRFSLMSKSFAYMRSVISSEEELQKELTRIDGNIEYSNSEIKAYQEKLGRFTKLSKSKLALIKELKSFKDLYAVIFKYKKLKEFYPKALEKIELQIEHHKSEIERHKENVPYFESKYKLFLDNQEHFSKVFSSVGYELSNNINDFYF